MAQPPRRKSLGELQRQIDAFNARFPIGQPVILQRDTGEQLRTVTRSEAQILSGHSAVIWVEGVSGCYLLDRVSPLASVSD